MSAAKPRVGLLGVWVDAVDNELLSLAQNLDLLRPALLIHKVGSKFGERVGGAEHECPLWRVANPHGNFTTIGKPVLCSLLDRVDGLRVGDVDVAGRVIVAEHPSVSALPALHLLVTGIELVLPSLKQWALTLAGDRGEPRGFQCQAHLVRRH